MSTLHELLKDKIRELEQVRKVRSHVQELTGRLQAEEESLAILEQTLDKEQKDVETLEKEGLRTMFRKFLGDREEQLEKERQDYLRVSLRFNELFKSVELIRFELDLLTKKEANLEKLQGEIELLFKEREVEILNHGEPAAQEIRGINQQTDKLNKFAVQVDEAFAVGQRAFELVQKAEHSLGEAQMWGQRDIWNSNNNADYMKQRSIDKAREFVTQARNALIHFGNELKDVDPSIQFVAKLELEVFSQFGDAFFDNLISDWIEQQKITKSFQAVNQMRSQVEGYLFQLEKMKGEIRVKLESLEKKLKEVITNT